MKVKIKLKILVMNEAAKAAKAATAVTAAMMVVVVVVVRAQHVNVARLTIGKQSRSAADKWSERTMCECVRRVCDE